MPINLLQPPPASWAAYRVALNNCDQQRRTNGFSICENIRVRDTMEQMSWKATISEGRRIITNNITWNDYDIAVLLGRKHEQKDWGLLGNMGVKGDSAITLDSNQDEVRTILQNMLRISGHSAFTTAAVDAIRCISNIYGFGIAIATRLITLTRPDCAVSINSGSAIGFAKLYNNGLPDDRDKLGRAANYQKLLSVIYAQPWYQPPVPSNPDEHTLWSMRAALLDAFVYGEK